jgi:MFS transporter, PAT family, beta-lactamase induction signal transducer AmpG
MDQPAARNGIAAFLERSALVMFGLGFAAGMPNQLANTALVIWLREAGASLALVGLITLATLTYALKFLWAPVVDRVGLPVLDKWLGRRRSWMLLTQVTVIIGLLLLSSRDPAAGFTATGDPTAAFIPFAIITVLIAFAGATQDIAIDAWRIEVAKDDANLSVLTATYQWGYRIAILLSGAAPLFIAQAINGDDYAWLGWAAAYASMAGFMLFAVIATLNAPRERVAPAPRWSAPADIPDRPVMEALEWLARLAIMVLAACFFGAGLAGKPEPLAWLIGGLYGGLEPMREAFAARPWGVWQQFGFVVVGLGLLVVACLKIPGVRTKPAAYFSAAMGAPLQNFFSRYQEVAMLILVFICVYRIADFILNLASTLYLDAGFGKDEIATVQKFFGAAMSAIGAGLAAWAVLKFGLFRCLIIGGFLQPLSNLAFCLIALNGAQLPLLYFSIAVDNLSNMFAGTCLIVYMSRLTAEGFTATQYAFFSSLYAMPGKLVAALSGRVVESAALASNGGYLAPITPWFANLPQGAFVEGAAKLGVRPENLAAGFFYTALLGIIGIIAAFVIAQGPARRAMEEKPKPAPA